MTRVEPPASQWPTTPSRLATANDALLDDAPIRARIEKLNQLLGEGGGRPPATWTPQLLVTLEPLWDSLAAASLRTSFAPHFVLLTDANRTEAVAAMQLASDALAALHPSTSSSGPATPAIIAPSKVSWLRIAALRQGSSGSRVVVFPDDGLVVREEAHRALTAFWSRLVGSVQRSPDELAFLADVARRAAPEVAGLSPETRDQVVSRIAAAAPFVMPDDKPDIGGIREAIAALEPEARKQALASIRRAFFPNEAEWYGLLEALLV